MGRRGTWLVVGALAAIATVAAVDALRGEGAAGPRSAPGTTGEETTTGAAAPAEEPQAAEDAFGGVLYYTDESCELRAVRLPTLETTDAPNWDECRFVLSPDGTRVSGAGSGWDPHSDPRIGRLFQSANGSIQISTNLGPEGEPIRGTSPAWRPNGRLTYVAGGEVRGWPDGETVLSRDDLAAAVRAHPDVPDSGRVREVVVEDTEWLDDERLALALSVPVEDAVEHAVAVFEGRRVAWVDFAGPRALFDLRVSSGGRFLAVMAGSSFLLFDSREGPIEVPAQIESDVHGLAWSPDEQWVAAAAGSSVYVFRPGEEARVQQLPTVASDLAWRGEAQPSPLVSTEAAREWLRGVAATGRLFVTEPTCRLSALRLPTLEWEDEPARDRAPCRFTLGLDDEPAPESFVFQPQGEHIAACHEGGVDVTDRFGVGQITYPDACAPAWTPDGRLTFVRNGELWIAPDVGTLRRLISRSELRDMFGREASLLEVSWLDDERVWAAVRTGEQTIIAAMTTSDLVYSPTFSAPRLSGLRVSSTGMVAATTDQGVVFFDTGGRRALSFPGATAVAWAPDTLVAAVAAPRELLFVAPISREVVAVPLPVEDLEWVVP